MRKMWPVLAALIVLTSACRLETNVTIDVAEDGSGTFVAELGLDDEMRGLLDSFGGSDELLAGLQLGDGTSETRTEGEMTYVSATQSFADLDTLREVVRSNQEQITFEVFEIDVDDDGARVIAKTGSLAGANDIDTDSLPFDVSSIGPDVFSANIFVKLPGDRATDNADEVMADGSLRWSISVTDPINIEAETTFGGGGLPWLPIGVGAIAVLGVGAFMVARKQGDAASTALAATEAPPAPLDFSDPAGASFEVLDPAEIPPEFPPQN